MKISLVPMQICISREGKETFIIWRTKQQELNLAIEITPLSDDRIWRPTVFILRFQLRSKRLLVLLSHNVEQFNNPSAEKNIVVTKAVLKEYYCRVLLFLILVLVCWLNLFILQFCLSGSMKWRTTSLITSSTWSPVYFITLRFWVSWL